MLHLGPIMSNHPKERALFQEIPSSRKLLENPRLTKSTNALGGLSSIQSPKTTWLGGTRHCLPPLPFLCTLSQVPCVVLWQRSASTSLSFRHVASLHTAEEAAVKGSQALRGYSECFVPSCRCAGKQISSLSYYCIIVLCSLCPKEHCLFLGILLPWCPISVHADIGHTHFAPRMWKS